MKCSVCGMQIPTGAAYCPTCGSITPYHVASSDEVSPFGPTMASLPSNSTIVSPPSQPVPYTPYPPPNPYDIPSFIAPPPPPPFQSTPYTSDPSLNLSETPLSIPPPSLPPSRPGRFSTVRIALVIVLLVVLIGTGGLLSFHPGLLAHQPQPRATTPARQTPVTSPPTAQVTSTATPQDLYTQITQTTPTLTDPLYTNDANHWTEETNSDGGCVFTGGSYHARVQQTNGYTLCVAQATNFSDLAYQVQMTIIAGEFGGIVFRTDTTQSKYYSFFINASGSYTFVTSIDNTGTHDRTSQGTSSFIKTGLNQTNLLAIIARGSTIYLYINRQYVTSINDVTYHDGQIGVFGGNTTQAPDDVTFSNVQVWKV